MPNLPAAKKAQRSTKNKTQQNKRVKAKLSQLTKKTLKLIEMGETKLAQQQLPQTYKAIDKAAKKGVIHPKKSARMKADLAKKVNNSAKDVKTAQKNT